MFIRITLPLRILVIAIALFNGLSMSAPAQRKDTLKGSINDELGASIVGATITLTDRSGTQRTARSADDGMYSLNLQPGPYRMSVSATGFAKLSEVEIEIRPNQSNVYDVTLKVAAIESEVKIEADNGVSTDPSANANQVRVTGQDLDALPDDPDELSAALRALAGPPIGPNGAEILIDGFSGQMPRRDSISEIRINQNPFGAENDSPGGRIDVVTRPAADQLHGDASVLFTDESLNSRNPLQFTSLRRTPFQTRNVSGSLTGPLKHKHASFIVGLDHHEVDDNDLVRAVVLDPFLNQVQLGKAVPVFERDTALLSRIDYAANQKNTLTARYRYYHYKLRDLGVGGFSLPERSYDRDSAYNFFRFAATSTLNANTLNVFEVQYMRNSFSNVARSSAPTLNVNGSFIGGGSSVGHAVNTNDRWELQNLTQLQRSTHAIKIGGRLRSIHIDDIDPANFNGQWSFRGGTAGQTSLERYQLTLNLMRQGLSSAAIRAAEQHNSVSR
jgi:Carboxypeptidase regulatory-like domain